MTAILEQTFKKFLALPEQDQTAIAQYLQNHEADFLKEVRKPKLSKKAIERQNTKTLQKSPWGDIDPKTSAVETGIEDLSVNHDHYLYGTPKRKP